jgi:uncharacterized protein (UPF0333 family)
LGLQLKGQVGLEFIILISVILFISVLVIGVTFYYLKDFKKDEKYYDVKAIGEQIRNEIYMAASVEDGYSRQFFLNNNTNYSIRRVNKSILVSSGSNSYASFVEIDFVGNLTRGLNNISKIDGVVYVN